MTLLIYLFIASETRVWLKTLSFFFISSRKSVFFRKRLAQGLFKMYKMRENAHFRWPCRGTLSVSYQPILCCGLPLKFGIWRICQKLIETGGNLYEIHHLIIIIKFPLTLLQHAKINIYLWTFWLPFVVNYFECAGLNTLHLSVNLKFEFALFMQLSSNF